MKKILYVIIIFIGICFVSCRTQSKIEYKDKEITKNTNITKVDTFIRDIRDSIYVNIYTKNDTTYIDKYKERFVYKDRVKIKIDTVTNDSIITEYKENIIIKTKTPQWCYILLFLNIIIISFVVIKFYYKWKKI
mgnify:CR=1 FL=1